MRIEKRPYSRGAWRLVYDDGSEVYAQQPLEHPFLGWTFFYGAVCGDTKSECIKKSLALLQIIAERSKEGKATRVHPVQTDCAKPPKGTT